MCGLLRHSCSTILLSEYNELKYLSEQFILKKLEPLIEYPSNTDYLEPPRLKIE